MWHLEIWFSSEHGVAGLMTGHLRDLRGLFQASQFCHSMFDVIKDGCILRNRSYISCFNVR